MSIHLATDKDFSYILDLSKRHAEELGFIPRAAMLAHSQAGRVHVSRENGDDVGYFLTNRVDQHQVRIFQACVQHDARGLKHGLSLLSDLVARAAANGVHFLSLHCRDGLESNGFWSACGFHVDHVFPGGRARGKIIFEWRLDIAAALSSGVLPYARHFLAGIGAGSTKSALQGAGKTFPPASQAAQTAGEILQYLDSRESNVIANAPTLRSPPAVAAELLRTLDLAARTLDLAASHA